TALQRQIDKPQGEVSPPLTACAPARLEPLDRGCRCSTTHRLPVLDAVKGAPRRSAGGTPPLDRACAPARFAAMEERHRMSAYAARNRQCCNDPLNSSRTPTRRLPS